MRNAIVSAVMCVAACLLAIPPASAQPQEIKSVKAFYYGNSYTGNTMPGLHLLLVKNAGKEWVVGAALSAGVPLWIHAKGVADKAPADIKGISADYDAVVMQVFAGEGLSKTVTEMWQGKVKFAQPTDVGDIAAATSIARAFFAVNPKGRAFIYTSWPSIPAARELADKINKGKKSKEEKRKLNHEEMETVRRDFDYAAQWLTEYDPANPAGKTHSRAHMYAVMEGLKKNLPEAWAQGRLGMIPVGDVFLELDKKMRAGKVPGLVNIGEYSADGGHLRSGLPRYTLAATFYAVLFREHPGRVDFKVFDDVANYESGKFGFYVHQPDLAVHIPITPERAQVVNDTIWEVVRHHPYCGIAEAKP